MGELRITDEGLLLDGRAEFTEPLYAVDIAAYQVCLPPHKHYIYTTPLHSTHCTQLTTLYTLCNGIQVSPTPYRTTPLP